MKKYILILSSLFFLNPAARADVFSLPENIRHLEIQLQGDASQLDLTQAANLTTLNAPACNITEVRLATTVNDLTNVDLSFNNISEIPILATAKNITIVNFDHCFMTEANVDQILSDLVDTDSTTIQADLRGNAPPSSAGMADIVIIESRGGTVLID